MKLRLLRQTIQRSAIPRTLFTTSGRACLQKPAYCCNKMLKANIRQKQGPKGLNPLGPCCTRSNEPSLLFEDHQLSGVMVFRLVKLALDREDARLGDLEGDGLCLMIADNLLHTKSLDLVTMF